MSGSSRIRVTRRMNQTSARGLEGGLRERRILVRPTLKKYIYIKKNPDTYKYRGYEHRHKIGGRGGGKKHENKLKTRVIRENRENYSYIVYLCIVTSMITMYVRYHVCMYYDVCTLLPPVREERKKEKKQIAIAS